jgi:hypothetical protein
MCRFSQTHTTAAESFVCEGKCFASEKRKHEKMIFEVPPFFWLKTRPHMCSSLLAGEDDSDIYW